MGVSNDIRISALDKDDQGQILRYTLTNRIIISPTGGGKSSSDPLALPH